MFTHKMINSFVLLGFGSWKGKSPELLPKSESKRYKKMLTGDNDREIKCNLCHIESKLFHGLIIYSWLSIPEI